MMNRAVPSGMFVGSDIADDGVTIADSLREGHAGTGASGARGSNPRRSTILSTCDGCGARVPIEQLSLVTFIEGEGFACEGCKGNTVVV